MGTREEKTKHALMRGNMLNPKNSNRIISYFHDTKNKSVKIKLEVTTQQHTITVEFINIYGIQFNDINPYQNLLLNIKKINHEKFYDQFIDYLKPQAIINGHISPTNILFSYTNKNEFIKTLKSLSLTCFSIESEWGMHGFIIAGNVKTTINKKTHSQSLTKNST